MTGKQLCETALIGDPVKVSKLLSTQGAQSFINYQDAHGITPLHEAFVNGHVAVTEKLIAVRRHVDLHRRILYCRLAPRTSKSSLKMRVASSRTLCVTVKS